MSTSAENSKPEECGCEAVEVKDSKNKLADISTSALNREAMAQKPVSALSHHSASKDVKSTPAITADVVPSSAKEVISNHCSENKESQKQESESIDPCCTGSMGTSQYVSSQSLSSQALQNEQNSTADPFSGQSSLSEPALGQATTSSDSKVIEDLQKEVDRLKKKLSVSQEMLSKMQEREKQLRNRLSEQAQRQLQKGSSKFEDLSLGESRPTQLIKRYGNLYTESRLDAMDALDDVPNMANCEDLKVKLLLSVVVLAFRSAEKTLCETKSKIRELLHIPRVTESGTSAFCLAAKDLEEAVAYYLRKTVDKHDSSKLCKEVCERVWTTLYDYPLLKECRGLLCYIEDCVRIAWAMTVQNPPFVIDYESRTYDPEVHSRFHTSDAGSPVIKSVLWPMLLEGEGGSCVSKGVVIT